MDKNISEFSAIQLAYLGDAVMELYVREYLITRHNISVENLHKSSIKYVSAKAQSYSVHELNDFFTQEELDYIRRGRNSKSHSKAKNATISQYRYATGLETLFGFLYLSRNKQRIKEIIDRIIYTIDSKEVQNE